MPRNTVPRAGSELHATDGDLPKGEYGTGDKLGPSVAAHGPVAAASYCLLPLLAILLTHAAAATAVC